MIERIVSYAQNNEDIILSAFFTDIEKGFYVDVGAFDPVEDSVTNYFYERGWSGINIEPNTALYERFVAARPRDINLNCGVAAKKGAMTLRQYNNAKGWSTLSDAMKEQYANKSALVTEDYTDAVVEVRTLTDILGDAKIKTIHFMKVDVEGYEYEVLKGNDWKRYRPQVLCIEANHIIRDWRTLLRKENYTFAFNDGLNDYYVAHEHAQRISDFKYVEMALGRPVLKYTWNEKLVDLETRNGRYQKSIEKLHEMVRLQKAETNALHYHFAESQRVRALARALPASIHQAILRRLRGKLDNTALAYPVVALAGPMSKVSAGNILHALHDADTQALNAVPDIQRRSQNKLWYALLLSYKGLARLAFRSARVGWRVLRRLRHLRNTNEKEGQI